MQQIQLNILIVEDDPIIATDIRLLLRQAGHQVVGHAKDALRAYDLLRSAQPDLAILDIHLGSGPSGIDVAEVIHQQYQLPYIFLTSFSDPHTLAAAQEQGPYGYLVKPFQEQTLLATIALAWSNHQRFHNRSSLDFASWEARLTPKEEAVCRQLCRGSSYKQICDELTISMNTLKYHVKNIYTKFDVAGRSELTAKLLS